MVPPATLVVRIPIISRPSKAVPVVAAVLVDSGAARSAVRREQAAGGRGERAVWVVHDVRDQNEIDQNEIDQNEIDQNEINPSDFKFFIVELLSFPAFPRSEAVRTGRLNIVSPASW
jgi:hypothetical protein